MESPTKKISTDMACGRVIRSPHILFDLDIDLLPRILELAMKSGLLQPLLGRFIKSHDTDHDVSNLVSLLHNFGAVTGMVTNMEKNSIGTIRCTNIDILATLQDFHAQLIQFPIKYLGLPLSFGRICRVDLQHYIDKATSRLNPWKEKNLNRVGCAESGSHRPTNFLAHGNQGGQGHPKSFRQN